eukprot:275194_1
MAESESKAKEQESKPEAIDPLMPKPLQSNELKVDLSPDLTIVTPDVHKLFAKYNKLFFDDAINVCEVKWIDSDEKQKQKEEQEAQDANKRKNSNNNNKRKPKRQKKYAGGCAADNAGLCCISLELTILQFKSTKYVIETIIHQMIHAYLIQNKVNAKIGHSPLFKSIMNAINKLTQPHVKLTTNNKQCKKNDDYPSEIIPDQLYLGNIRHALNLEILRDIKITHVINCTQSIDCKFGPQGIKYIRVPVNDKVSVSILPFFVQAIRWIEKVREENGSNNDNRILIHCHAGISRSATITIAYLMYSWHMTMFEAITHVQGNRYIIQPNQGFKNQLLDFYLYLEAHEGNLDDFEKQQNAQRERAAAQIKAPPAIKGNVNGGNKKQQNDENKNKNQQPKQPQDD